MFIELSLIILMWYILCSVGLFIVSSYHFSVYSALLRKILYALFLLGITIGILKGVIDYKDWKLLLQLTAVIVFIDLCIYQTPNILKIWKAEFQHADIIADNVKKNEDRIRFMNRKTSEFSSIVQRAEDDLTSTNIGTITTEQDYQDKLISYLNKYAEKFDFKLRIHFIPDSNDQEIKEGILDGLNRMETLFNIEINKKEKEKFSSNLFQAQVIALEGDKYAVVPIYGSRFNFLLIVSAQQEGIIEIDTANLINLITLFDWIV